MNLSKKELKYGPLVWAKGEDEGRSDLETGKQAIAMMLSRQVEKIVSL
jgi:hypothetical protein